MASTGIVRHANSLFIKIFSYTSAFLIRTFWLGKTEGLEYIPDTPCIIISNHESYLDFLLLGYVLRRKANKNFSFWAKTKVLNHFIWKIYSNIFSTIEVNGSIRKLNELSQQAMERGEYVCIFPEGKRTRNGKLQVFMMGYLRLASLIGTEIVPVYLENTFRAWPSHKLFPRFRKCQITFFPSVAVSKELTEEELEEVNRTMMKKYEEFSNKSHCK
jgi:long-chain acyl-CoA synthetase